MSYLKSASWNLSNRNFCLKKPKMSKVGCKNALFRLLQAQIKKSYCHIWNQYPRIYLISKFWKKMKNPKFGTKNALFGLLWAQIWKKAIVMFEISILEFVSMQNFQKKCLNLGLKLPYLGIFELDFLKNYCHISNQHLQICQFGKFLKKPNDV